MIQSNLETVLAGAVAMEYGGGGFPDVFGWSGCVSMIN